MLGNPDLGKFDCGIKNAGFWNSEHDSRNPKSHPTMRGIQNPSFADKAWNPVLNLKSCIHDGECRVQDCLVFHYRRIVYRVLNIQVDLSVLNLP